MEFGDRQQHVEQFHRRTDQPGREPRRPGQAVSVRRHPRWKRRCLYGLRLRAIHAEQRAALQDVSAPRQLHEVQQQPFADVRRQRGAIQLRERVLPRQAERLRLQHAGRVHDGRQRVLDQPGSNHVSDHAPPVPGAVHQHSWSREAGATAGSLVRRRLRTGRMAAKNQPHGHRRRPLRRSGFW
jgi:hypothetical protein